MEAETLGLDAATIALAAEFETAAVDQDGVTIIAACCWVLADLILQAERVKLRPTDQSLILVMRYLVSNVERLRSLAGAEVRH